MTGPATNDDPPSPVKTPEPKTGFAAFWGSSADLKSSGSSSSLLLYGAGGGSGGGSNFETTTSNSSRPGTAPSSGGRRRPRSAQGGKKLQHSFSERILRPKSRASRPSTAGATKRPPLGSSASIASMNKRRARKGKTTLSYTQKYKYGLQRSVFYPIAKQTVQATKFNEVLTVVVQSMSAKYGDSSAKETARAVLRSVLDFEPSAKDIQKLAAGLKYIDEEIAPATSSNKHGGDGHGHAAYVLPWKKQPVIVKQTKRRIELLSTYCPNPLLVKKWIRSRPSLNISTANRQSSTDHTRIKVEKINTMIDEAMHIRSGMQAERQRRKKLIELFLHAMATGGIDVRQVSETFMQLDVDGSGSVDRSEFANALHELELGISTKNCGSLFDAIDIDQSGDLEISEFMEAITGTMREEVRDSIHAVVHSDKIDSLAIELDIKHRKEVKKASATVVKRVKELMAQRSFAGGMEAALMELFMKSDIDHSGSISRDEFSLAMKSLGVELEKRDIDAVLSKADKDGGGELEYWEFVKMLRPPKRKKLVRQDDVGEGESGVPIFGVKHESDMQLVYGRRSMVQETERLKRKQLHDQIEIFRPIDAQNALRALYVALASKHMTGSQLYEFFLDLDKDGSGTIDAEEFRHTMQKVLRLGLTGPQLDALAKKLDGDSNGDVCYLELKTALTFDRNEEGAHMRATAKLNSYERSLEPKELVASKSIDSSPFTKVLPFKPFGGFPVKKVEVPSEGGRYATPLEAHRQWYCPGSRLKALPRSEYHPGKALKSFPKPKIRSRSRPLRKPATPTPYFLQKPTNSLPATNFFSGMLGQKSLLERGQVAMARSKLSALPDSTTTNFSSANRIQRIATSSSSAKPQSMTMESIPRNTMTVGHAKPRPKSQQRSKSQTVGRNSPHEQGKKLTRASTAPIGLSRYD